MKTFDKVLLFVMCILVIVMSIVLFTALIGIASFEVLETGWKVAGCVAAVICIAIALRMFFAFKNTHKSLMPTETTGTLIQNSEIGSSYISLAALDALVQKSVKSNNRVRECRSAVTSAPSGGIDVELRLIVMPETKLVDMTAALQKTVKEQVESASGINVKQIKIIIESAANTTGSRVG